jgi:hypothetical protein
MKLSGYSMRRHLLGALIAILAFTSTVFVYNKSRRLAGAVEAYIDIFRGRYIIKASGRLAAEIDEYNVVLKEYGVEVVAVGGCAITEELREGIIGYNTVSMEAIEKKYGKFIWQRLTQRLGRPDPELMRERNIEFARRCKALRQ